MTVQTKLRVAVLDTQPIEPATGGGRLRLLGLYHALGPQFSTAYVGTYDWPGPQYRRQMLSPTLEEILVPLSKEHFAAAEARRKAAGGRVVIDSTFAEFGHLSPDFVNAARDAARSAQVVVFSHPWIFPLVRSDLDPQRQLIVYDSHNVEGILRMELLDDGSVGTEIVREVVRTEYELCHFAHLVLACSEEDRDGFVRMYDLSHDRIRLFPNGTFTQRIRPATPREKSEARKSFALDASPVVLFIGSNYAPNVEAANFIVDRLAAAVPEVMFVIAGSVRDGLSTRQLPFNVRLPGLIYEAAKLQWLHASDIAINPMFGGSGTNIKMIDYMAAGLPIVSTPMGARGLGAEKRFLLQAEADAFAECIRSVAQSAKLASRLGRAAQTEATKHFSWEEISPRLGSLLMGWNRSVRSRPRVSVILQIAEGANAIPVLSALARQRLPNFEVVVAAQSDLLPPPAPAEFPLQWISAPAGDGSRACNLAANIASGRMLAFLKSEFLPDDDWLRDAFEASRAADAAVLEGRITPPTGSRETNTYFSAANLFVRSDVFHALGGFGAAADEKDRIWRAQRFGPVTATNALVRARSADELEGEISPDLATEHIGWFSSWQAPCGIAEYSRNLLDGVLSAAPSLRVSIFCDTRTRTDKTARIPVISCWTEGMRDIQAITRALAQTAPDRLVIQHHPGLFPWPSLCDLLESDAILGLPVLVTLHNTRELIGLSPHLQNRCAAALKRAERILVHTLADYDRLESFGVLGAVRLFPHGAHVSNRRRHTIRALDALSEPVVGCFGFFFAHKGIHALIEAVAMLRARGPKVRLRLVNAALPRADSQSELRRCRETTARLGLLDCVDWFTEFLEEDTAVDLLSQADLIVLPYAHTPESASGALRIALASGAPVATSGSAIFDEAEGAVTRLSGAMPSQLASSIDSILRDQHLRTELSRAAEQWLYCRRWTKMGVGLLHHLYRYRSDDVPDGISDPSMIISPGARAVSDTISTSRPAA